MKKCYCNADRSNYIKTSRTYKYCGKCFAIYCNSDLAGIKVNLKTNILFISNWRKHTFYIPQTLTSKYLVIAIVDREDIKSLYNYLVKLKENLIFL